MCHILGERLKHCKRNNDGNQSFQKSCEDAPRMPQHRKMRRIASWKCFWIWENFVELDVYTDSVYNLWI